MIQPKGLSNIGMKSRVKQLIILVVAILLCVVISQVAEAKDKYRKGQAWRYKGQYKTQIHRQKKECSILAKRQIEPARAKGFSGHGRRSKASSRPRAEQE